MNKKLSKIILICAIAIIIPIAIVTTVLCVSGPAIYQVSITKEGNGSGTYTTPAASGYKKGVTVTLNATPAEGSRFDGWRIKGEADFVSTEQEYTFVITGKTELTVTFSQLIYNASFDLGYAGAVNPDPVNEMAYNAVLPTPERAGYRFNGWRYGDKLYTTATFDRPGNVALTADWSKQYKLTLDYGTGYKTDNYVDTEFIAYDTEKLVGLPATLEGKDKNRNIFLGWFIENTKLTADSIFDAETMENATITAKWDTAYKISLDYADGTEAVEFYSVNGKVITIDKVPEKKYHDFKQWNYKDTENKFDATLPLNTDVDVDLVAQFVPTDFDIIYNLGEGTNGSNPITYNINTEDITLLDAVSTSEEYVFEGWYTTADFQEGTKITVINPGVLDEEFHANITLYAHYILKPYDIEYVLDGGVNAQANPATYNKETIITFADPTKEGYTFEGWFTDAAFTEANKVTGIDAPKMEVLSKITIYAKWTLTNYDITYVAKSSTGKELTISMPEDAKNTYVITDETFTFATPNAIAGYTFDKWYATSDFTGDPVTEIVKGSTGNKTFYARFLPDTYTLQYKSDVATENTNVASANIEQEFSFIGLTSEKDQFIGWFATYDESTKVYSNQVTTFADAIAYANADKAIVLYAKWQVKAPIGMQVYFTDARGQKYFIKDAAGNFITDNLNPVYATTGNTTMSLDEILHAYLYDGETPIYDTSYAYTYTPTGEREHVLAFVGFKVYRNGTEVKLGDLDSSLSNPKGNYIDNVDMTKITLSQLIELIGANDGITIRPYFEDQGIKA